MTEFSSTPRVFNNSRYRAHVYDAADMRTSRPDRLGVNDHTPSRLAMHLAALKKGVYERTGRPFAGEREAVRMANISGRHYVVHERLGDSEDASWCEAAYVYAERGSRLLRLGALVVVHELEVFDLNRPRTHLHRVAATALWHAATHAGQEAVLDSRDSMRIMSRGPQEDRSEQFFTELGMVLQCGPWNAPDAYMQGSLGEVVERIEQRHVDT